MELLEQFSEFLEKQDVLSKLTESNKLHPYGYSEIHVVTIIGQLAEPTVTTIAECLKLTKGAVSKITKKLIAKEIIEAYKIPTNKQKVFFKLTQLGDQLYNEHEQRHQLWLERDSRFLNQFSTSELDTISKFMRQYNHYLEKQIKERGKI